MQRVAWAKFITLIELSLQVFEQFLAGNTLEECYAAVASVANRWLDMLDTQVSRGRTQFLTYYSIVSQKAADGLRAFSKLW